MNSSPHSRSNIQKATVAVAMAVYICSVSAFIPSYPSSQSLKALAAQQDPSFLPLPPNYSLSNDVRNYSNRRGVGVNRNGYGNVNGNNRINMMGSGTTWDTVNDGNGNPIRGKKNQASNGATWSSNQQQQYQQTRLRANSNGSNGSNWSSNNYNLQQYQQQPIRANGNANNRSNWSNNNSVSNYNQQQPIRAIGNTNNRSNWSSNNSDRNYNQQQQIRPIGNGNSMSNWSRNNSNYNQQQQNQQFQDRANGNFNRNVDFNTGSTNENTRGNQMRRNTRGNLKYDNRNVDSLTAWASYNNFQLSPSVSLVKTDSNTNDYGLTFNNRRGSVSGSSTSISTTPDYSVGTGSTNAATGSGTSVANYRVREEDPMLLLSVPKSFVFDSNQIYQEWMQQKGKYQLIQPALQSIRQNGKFSQYVNHFILIVKLYEEYKLGEQSKWYTWMKSLPPRNSDFQTGVNMDDIEISCLPPFAKALAFHEKEKLRVFYQAFQSIRKDALFSYNNNNNMRNQVDSGNLNRLDIPFINNMVGNDSNRQQQQGPTNYRNRMNTNTSYDQGYNMSEDELFQWLFNVVHTRCWSYESDNDEHENVNPRSQGNNKSIPTPIIVPLGDMFNHREPANVFVQDSATSDYVDFVYSNEKEVEYNLRNRNGGLYLSYGLTNPHRFLVIFGFCDTSMPEVFSQLIFTNPSKEMISLGCNDRSNMVYRSQDGGIPNTIWDCIMYTLLEQVPQEQAAFYQAYRNRDVPTQRYYHEKYLLEAAMTLRPHVMNTVSEHRELLGKIDGIVQQIEANGQRVQDVHPRLMMIKKHNEFLCGVFDKVRARLDNISQIEVKKRTEQLSSQQSQQTRFRY
jgi:hypothetical protein